MPRDLPRYHPRIRSDIKAVFRAFEPDEEYSKARAEAFGRLQELVRAIDSGAEYELVDVSFCLLDGAANPYNLPLECIIIDKTRPEGLAPSFGNASPPLPYDAIALTRFLGAHGFEGTLVDTKPDLVGFNPGSNDLHTKPAPMPPEPPWGAAGLPAHFRPFSALYPVLPPVLRIRPQHAEEPEVLLSPAHPSHLLRWALARDTCQTYPSFSVTSSLFWLWLRSWGIAHFLPSTCAFLLLSFYQGKYKTGSLNSKGSILEGSMIDSPENQLSRETSEKISMVNVPVPATETPPPTLWTRQDSDLEPKYYKLEVPHVAAFRDPGIDQLGPQLLNVLNFWATQSHISNSCVFNLLAGAPVPRVRKYRGRARDFEESKVTALLRQKAEAAMKSGSNSNSGTQPVFWEYNPLVLSDPFVPQHLMMRKALSTFAKVKTAHPITEIFGEQLQPFIKIRECRRSFLGCSAALPSLDLRRMYHSRVTEGNVMARDNGNFFRTPRVPQAVLNARSKTLQRVQNVIQEKYGQRYRVECFGSTRYGVDSASSDLDLVVLDPDRTNGFTPTVDDDGLPPIYNVKDLGKTLEKGRFRIKRVIPWASVPIVKLEDPYTHINCDINVNDQLGLFNTMLIAKYCELSPILQPMLAAIKTWAKSLGLNDPSGEKGAATFSSYALTLMTIGFLQTNELLPNLQAGLTPLLNMPASPVDDGFWLRAKSGERVRCDPRFDHTPAWTAPADANMSLRDALTEWFRYWGHQHRYAFDVVSIREGGVVPRSVKVEPTATVNLPSRRKRRNKENDSKGKEKRSAEEARNLKFSTPKADADENDQYPIETLTLKEAMQGGDPAEAAFGELREADMNKGRQPDTWALSALVVADPFILTKNATGAIIARAVERFKEECRCAVLILDGGGEFDELLGDGENYGAARRGHTRRRGSAPILRGKRGSPEQGQGQGQQKDKNKNEGNDMNRVQDQDQRGDRSNSQSRSQSRNQDQQQKQKRTRSHSPVKDRPSSKGVDGKGKDYVTAGRGGGRGGRGRKGRGQSAPPVRARTPSEAAA